MIGVGDVVVCIKRGEWTCAGTGEVGAGPRYGEILKVRRTGMGRTGQVLWLEGWSGDELWHSYRASRFRKVQHDKREACEAEFAILLKLSKKRANA